jgi:hypothetical protein
VIDLDMTISFTAARARNAGFGRLREIAPDLAFDAAMTRLSQWWRRALRPDQVHARPSAR